MSTTPMTCWKRACSPARPANDVVVPTSSYLARQILAGAYQPLDMDKLPNAAGLDEKADGSRRRARCQQRGTPSFTWGHQKRHRLQCPDGRRTAGEDAPHRQLVPGLRSGTRRASSPIAGISFPSIRPPDMFPVALQYLGLEPNSTNEADLEKAAETVWSRCAPAMSALIPLLAIHLRSA